MAIDFQQMQLDSGGMDTTSAPQTPTPQLPGTMGLLNDVAQSPWTRVAGTTLGGIGGLALAPLTGGTSIPIGLAAGYGGSAAFTESLKNLLGTQNRTGQEQLGSNVTNFATIYSLAELLSFLLHPNEQLGALRSKLIGNKTVTSPDLRNTTLANLENSDYFRAAPAETQQAARTRLQGLLDLVNPLKSFNTTPIEPISPINLTETTQETVPEVSTTGNTILRDMRYKQGNWQPTVATESLLTPTLPTTSYTGGTMFPPSPLTGTPNLVSQYNPTVPISDIYSKLPSFESTGRAYLKGGDMPSTALGGGTNLASHAMRDYLSTQIGLPAKITNDIMGKIYAMQESTIGRYIPRIAMGLTAYRLIPAILKKLQSQR